MENAEPAETDGASVPIVSVTGDMGTPPASVGTAVATVAKPKRKTFYGWWIVGASGAMNGPGGSVHRQGSQVFFLPVAAGVIYDRTGSYNYALIGGAGLFLGGAVTFLLLKRPVRKAVVPVAA